MKTRNQKNLSNRQCGEHISAPSSEARNECRTAAVRRSPRLRPRTSPYFVKNNQKKEGSSSSKSASSAKKESKQVRTKANDSLGAKADPSKRKRAARNPNLSSDEEVTTVPEAVRVHGLARQVNFYGLIQELVTPNVFRLLVATCLLNQTKGRAAMPVFWELLRRWPDEHSLAQADVVELTSLLQPIGLHNIRARRLIHMAQRMVEVPYDESNSFKSRDRTAPDTPIGIYPGVGRYAIDSWRIFVAGGGASVGLEGDRPVSPFDIGSSLTTVSDKDKSVSSAACSMASVSIEPEWKSVMPLDKELRAYLIWRWAKEGQVWDPLLGLVSAFSEPQ